MKKSNILIVGVGGQGTLLASVLLGNLALPSDGGASAALGTIGMGEAAKEAVQALVALGYSNMEANKAVKQVEVTEGMTAEDVLKASLKYLTFL